MTDFQRRLRRAEAHLRGADPVMHWLVDRLGPCKLRPADKPPLASLVETVLAQQISKAAADAIHERVLALFGGRSPSAARILATADRDLRDAGVSRPKIRTLKGLAERVHSGELPLGSLARLSDDEVIDRLTRVPGIGDWTAEVFLIFRLGRLDVLAVDDLGLRDATRRFYRLGELPGADELDAIAEPWRPYRSVGCWYLWRGRRELAGNGAE